MVSSRLAVIFSYRPFKVVWEGSVMEYTQHGIKLGIDPRARAILLRLGVTIGELHATDAPLRWQLPFSFSGDRESAKYHVETFLSDEYNATNVQFFASLKNPRNVYCQFTPRGSDRG
jgi:hypothetical protein